MKIPSCLTNFTLCIYQNFSYTLITFLSMYKLNSLMHIPLCNLSFHTCLSSFIFPFIFSSLFIYTIVYFYRLFSCPMSYLLLSHSVNASSSLYIQTARHLAYPCILACCYFLLYSFKCLTCYPSH